MEGEGGQFRRDHLAPVPKVRDLEELNRLLAASSKEEESRVIAGRGQPTGAAMLLEKAIADVIREGKHVTYDMKPSRDDPTAVGTSEYADAIIEKLEA